MIYQRLCQQVIKSKPELTLSKGWLNLNNVKLKHSLSERKYKYKIRNYHLHNDNEIMCEDCKKCLTCTWALYKLTICKCVVYRANWNLYCSYHSTNYHRRKQHAIVKGAKYNKVNETDKINLIDINW